MPELMTVEELGQYLRFTKKTIYKLLKQESIPSVKIGKKWRFDKDAIDNWLRQNTKGAKARILVIDDEQIVNSLFKDTLENQGQTVVAANSGTQGIEYVKQQNFDLVFLDLKLPDMEGAEVFREIRKINPTIPVTIITGYPGSEMMERAIKEGPLGVMNKPFNDSDIIAAVNSFLHAILPRR